MADRDVVYGVRLEQLAALLRSGADPAEATTALARSERHGTARAALRRAAASLQQGQSLGQSLSAIEGLELARRALPGGQPEADGGAGTPAALERLAAHLRVRGELRATARVALLYPQLLLLGLLGLLALFVFFVGPRLEHYLMDMGAGALTVSLQFLLELGFVPVAMTTAVVYGLAVYLGRRRPELGGRILGRIPVLGEAMRRLAAADFFAGLAVRLEAGSAVSTAYAEAAASVAPAFGARIGPTVAAVRSSGCVADGLALLGKALVRPLEGVLVAAAEPRGADAMARAAHLASRRLLVDARAGLRVLGSSLVVALGLLVLWLGVVINSPMLEMSGNIGAGW